ncbi:hypothetical protein E3O55_08330 [Cryobacterium sp. MDB1-18-2]|uniref:hypothetical protein n=1 Tax=unclassified Cryobacterium TaxID=2649013 RepID=UPI001069D6D1|nr:MULTISPECIES: hypothetical protein [unclassified Cryobacterium]TFC30083.1 hypothetical protein E3O55_08330 [Cryobacterium sp. MDB1-18-2]TFC41363.1 hypothetical protein E3O50_09770 [Cryobacterium sp. MDB1-18-1]
MTAHTVMLRARRGEIGDLDMTFTGSSIRIVATLNDTHIEVDVKPANLVRSLKKLVGILNISDRATGIHGDTAAAVADPLLVEDFNRVSKSADRIEDLPQHLIDVFAVGGRANAPQVVARLIDEIRNVLVHEKTSPSVVAPVIGTPGASIATVGGTVDTSARSLPGEVDGGASVTTPRAPGAPHTSGAIHGAR